MSGLLALVSGRDPDTTGDGHAIYVRAHARAALAAGYAPETWYVGREPGVRETDYGVVRAARSHGPVRQHLIAVHSPRLARAVVRRAREVDGPVVVHGFGVWGHAAVAARDALRREGREARAVIGSYTTYVVEARSQVRGAAGAPARVRASYGAQSLWARAVVERSERAAYRGADRVWVNYETVARMVAARHGVRVERHAYAPESDFLAPPPSVAGAPGAVRAPGAALAPAAPPTLAALAPAGAPLVLCASRHHARKGTDVLIDALALLRDQGIPVRACLLGGGPLLEEDRRRVRALGLEDRVAVPGLVPAVEPYLAAADVFALPSREEQSGSLALLEALRWGLPAVAGAVDGIPEDVTHERDALLVAPGDAAALAGALRRLIVDTALRARLAEGARATFTARFSAERFARDVGAAYAALGLPPR